MQGYSTVGIEGEYTRITPAGSGLELSCCSLLHVVRGD